MQEFHPQQLPWTVSQLLLGNIWREGSSRQLAAAQFWCLKLGSVLLPPIVPLWAEEERSTSIFQNFEDGIVVSSCYLHRWLPRWNHASSLNCSLDRDTNDWSWSPSYPGVCSGLSEPFLKWSAQNRTYCGLSSKTQKDHDCSQHCISINAIYSY